MTLLLFFVIPLRMTANRMLTLASVITVVGIVFPNWLLGKHVAHVAHLGGLISGLIVVRLFMRRMRR
jgi:membrane associated rhomboid family serine protease